MPIPAVTLKIITNRQTAVDRALLAACRLLTTLLRPVGDAG